MKRETPPKDYAYDPETGLWDGNLMLIDPHAGASIDEKDMYFLTCAWCGLKDSWRLYAGSPECWVDWPGKDRSYGEGEFPPEPTYPLPAWVCDDCKAFLRKYAKNFNSYGGYGEYLKSPQWERVRWKALLRAEHKCQLCSSRDRLDVYHNTYENLGRERPGDLLVLCHACHGKYHDGKRKRGEA